MDRFVSSYDLKGGLLKLGIGVSSKVADILLQELGGTIHGTARDLATLTQHVGDFKVQVGSSATRTKASAGENSATGGSFSSQDEFSVDEQKDETMVRSRGNKAKSGALEPVVATSQQDGRGQGVTCSSGLGHTDDDTVPPLVPSTRPCSQKHPTKFLWDELPCWAREASKSALRELMGHHHR